MKTGILETSRHNIEAAAARCSLDEAILARLLSPKERLAVAINPKLPSGRVLHIDAFMVRHNDTLGPSKGGLRFAAGVTLDDISGLAAEMTWKTALLGVPFGGGKSGIRYAPELLTPDEKEVIIRSFVRAVHRYIGPETYIPAPDMGTNSTDMGHIRDCIAYSSGTSITNGCFVTGKPVILGGIAGRAEATGTGGVHLLAAACEPLGRNISDMRVALQGFGNVGSVVAREMSELGAKLIAVGDISGGTTNATGLDIAAFCDHIAANGAVKGFSGGTDIPAQAVLEIDCDILIPAATESVITASNAPRIKAAIIAEGANGPTTPAGDKVLADRGIFVIPDILCNAGGVFVSYLEYTQETQREQMTLEQVSQRLKERLCEKFDSVYDRSRGDGLAMRDAAMDIALARVVEGIQSRGELP